MTVAALGVVCAGAVAACGSSSKKSPTTSTPKTVAKATIISQGDAICARLNKGLPALPNTDPSKASGAQLKRFAPALLKTGQIIGTEVQQVRALGTPDTDAALFGQVLAEGVQASANFQAAGQAAARGDRKAFLSAFAALNNASQHGKQFGFRVCDTQ